MKTVELFIFYCDFAQFHFYYGHSHGRIWNPPLRSANPVAFCLPPTSAGWGHPALHPTEKGTRRAASPLAAVPASGHSKPSVQSLHPHPAAKRGCCKTKVEQQPLFLLKSIRGGVFWGKDVEKLPVF